MSCAFLAEGISTARLPTMLVGPARVARPFMVGCHVRPGPVRDGLVCSAACGYLGESARSPVIAPTAADPRATRTRRTSFVRMTRATEPPAPANLSKPSVMTLIR
jgi:hypothetical protein